MKKIFSAAFLLISVFALAQQPVSNLYQNPSPVPIYTPLSYISSGINYPQTGTMISYYYDTLATPTSDTIRVTFNGATHTTTIVNVTHNLILLFDTTGDTASYSNFPNGKATVWHKKQPFQLAHNLDEIKYVFESGSTSSYFKVTVPKFNSGLPGDTIHVPAKTTTNGGGSFVTATYIYQKGAVVWAPYTTW